MFTETLSMIYHNFNSLGCFERLLRRARQLPFLNLTRKTVQEYLKYTQAYTPNMPARPRFTRNHTYLARIDAQ